MADNAVVFYSYEGNTAFVAQEIANVIDADIIEIKPEKEKKRSGLGKYIWGGRQVVTKKTPKLLPLDTQIDSYKNVVIGTPVWASSFAPAIRTLLTENLVKGKNVAIFCTHDGGPGNTIEEMEESLKNNNKIVSSKEFKGVKKDRDSIKGEILSWAKELKDLL